MVPRSLPHVFGRCQLLYDSSSGYIGAAEQIGSCLSQVSQTINRASNIVKYFEQTTEDDPPANLLCKKYGEVQFFAAVNLETSITDLQAPFLLACIEEYMDVQEHTAEDDFWTEWTYKHTGRRPLTWIKISFLQCKVGTLGSATTTLAGRRFVLDRNMNPFTLESLVEGVE